MSEPQASVADPWAPPAPAMPPAWADLTIERAPDGRVVAAAALAAVLFDAGVRAGPASIGAAVLFIATTVALVVTGRVTNRRAWPLLAAACVFAIALPSRSSPWLVVPDVVAILALLALASALARDGDPFDLTIPRVIERAAAFVVHAIAAPAFVGRVGPRATDARGMAPVARGLIVALPVVVVLGALLASADAVFASVFRLPDAGALAGHAALLGMGAWGMGALLRTASARSADALAPRPRWLGRTEAAVVLGALVVLFAGFAVAQVVALAGGAEHVLDTRGLTYAEYARSGFFQLLAVAALTLAIILAIRATLAGEITAALLVLAEAAIALTVVIVAVAIRRLGLYEDAYGLTMLRLYSTLAAAWIGCVFAFLAVHLATPRGRQWFVSVSAAAALAVLVALHVANPEALVVRRNVEHYERTGRFDPWYPDGLSDDAVPALLDTLDRVPPTDREQVRQAACRDQGGKGPWAFNTSAVAADAARRDHCGRR